MYEVIDAVATDAVEECIRAANTKKMCQVQRLDNYETFAFENVTVYHLTSIHI